MSSEVDWNNPSGWSIDLLIYIVVI